VDLQFLLEEVKLLSCQGNLEMKNKERQKVPLDSRFYKAMIGEDISGEMALLKEFLKVENKKLKQRSVDLCIYGNLHN
jgi:hypothetical protein